MKHSSRNRLNHHHLQHFPGNNLFDKIARTVCQAGCLPRKELYEAWEVCRRAHRRIKGRRVIDLACGHGLAAHIMCLLDRTIPEAVAVDQNIPPSASSLNSVLTDSWPHLDHKVRFQETDLAEIAIGRDDLLLSVHACGSLTDLIIDRAIDFSAAVVLLPCCHNLKQSDTGSLAGWLEPTLAVDVTRVARLESAGYNVTTQEIPIEITPRNRLIIATPGAGKSA